jgi:hypothetical protein
VSWGYRTVCSKSYARQKITQFQVVSNSRLSLVAHRGSTLAAQDADAADRPAFIRDVIPVVTPNLRSLVARTTHLATGMRMAMSIAETALLPQDQNQSALMQVAAPGMVPFATAMFCRLGEQ